MLLFNNRFKLVKVSFFQSCSNRSFFITRYFSWTLGSSSKCSQIKYFLYIGITLVDLHLNWLNWFLFLILEGGLLVILIDCMIFLTIPTIIHNIYETTLVFMWNKNMEKFQFLFFSTFLLVSTKLLFWEDDWALGYNSRKFWDFPGLSKFPKILSLKSFTNSWGNSYIPSLLLIIALRFTCSESKIW